MRFAPKRAAVDNSASDIIIPPSAVTSNRTLHAEPGLVIMPDAGTVELLSPARVSDEAAIQSAASYPLQLRLVNDTFEPAAIEYDTGAGIFSSLLHGLRPADTGAHTDRVDGWTGVVQHTRLRHLNFELLNESTVIAVAVPQGRVKKRKAVRSFHNGFPRSVIKVCEGLQDEGGPPGHVLVHVVEPREERRQA